MAVSAKQSGKSVPVSASTRKSKLKKEIYTYEAPWQTYSLAWSNMGDTSKSFRLAVGSFKLEYSNVVNVRNRNSKD